jgi:hypothetical protein
MSAGVLEMKVGRLVRRYPSRPAWLPGYTLVVRSQKPGSGLSMCDLFSSGAGECSESTTPPEH